MMSINVLQKEEILTGTGNTLSPFGVTVVRATSANGSGTLGDPAGGTGARGTLKLIVMDQQSDTYYFDVTIANHETSSPEVMRFDSAGDWALLMWTGAMWVTVGSTVTLPA
jgi:hypothetical protein